MDERTAATSSTGEAERRLAADAALSEIRDGMRLGLGSGRTASLFVRGLAERVKAGLKVTGVATSKETDALARETGIPLTSLDDDPILDLTVDGADEIDPQLRLIKGGGGALLREKIVATASRRMIVLGDSAKLVAELGAFPLPIEVVPFGFAATRAAIERTAAGLGLYGSLTMRRRGEDTFVTDSGNRILDASFGRIPDPEALANELSRIPGVVEHELFIGLASTAVVAHGEHVEWLSP